MPCIGIILFAIRVEHGYVAGDHMAVWNTKLQECSVYESGSTRKTSLLRIGTELDSTSSGAKDSRKTRKEERKEEERKIQPGSRKCKDYMISPPLGLFFYCLPLSPLRGSEER